jgi:hypothetical protein
MDQFTEERRTNAITATDALLERIRRYFAEQAPNEQAIHIAVDSGQTQVMPGDEHPRQALRFTLPEGTLLEGYYRIANVGGNMYEVEAGIGERSERFSISLPEATLAADSTYGRPVCEFLLEEIKRIAGEQYLRSSSATSQSGQSVKGIEQSA